MVSTVSNPKSSHEQVLDIVLKEDDLNWKDLIMDLVRSEGMDTWDIDVSLLAKRFLELLTELKEMDFRISGKMVLASSLLLKIKSDRLLLDGIAGLDNLINGQQEEEYFPEEGDAFEYEQYDLQQFLNDQKKIVPRTPQPRERKVSVFDLVSALEQALDADAKRHRVMSKTRGEQEEVKAPKKVFDLSQTMESISTKLGKLFIKPTTKIYFHDLTPGTGKQEMVYTFLPLLHLENARKVDLFQEDHFGPIEVQVKNRKF
jgi:segregation and condensation protein A